MEWRTCIKLSQFCSDKLQCVLITCIWYFFTWTYWRIWKATNKTYCKITAIAAVIALILQNWKGAGGYIHSKQTRIRSGGGDNLPLSNSALIHFIHRFAHCHIAFGSWSKAVQTMMSNPSVVINLPSAQKSVTLGLDRMQRKGYTHSFKYPYATLRVISVLGDNHQRNSWIHCRERW